MAIVSVPATVGTKETVFCIVCGDSIALGEATAGFRGANDEQAFACNGHFRSGGQYIVGWVDFVASERRSNDYRYSEAYSNNQHGGGSGFGWALY